MSGAFFPITFFLIAYFISVISQQITPVLPKWLRPPHSILLYLLGMLVASASSKFTDTEWGTAVTNFLEVDPHVIFWLFLPMLLYEDAATSPWHVVRRVFPSALLLAFPGVILNTVLTGFTVHAYMDLSLNASLVMGSILSATDPVAVIGALHALQAPAKLSSIIAGEALLNDGSAVAIFQIFMEVASGRAEFDIFEAILKMLRLSLGGPLLGLVVGLFVQVWLRMTRNFQIEMLLIFISIYGLFFVAEHEVVEVSGVLAVVSFGFFMAALGKYSLKVENRAEHHTIVEFVASMSNEAIFIIAGVVGWEFSFNNEVIEARDWLDLAILFVLVHITRTIVLACCFPFLRKWGYHLSFKEAIICLYGGLRGAVGLAMALLVLGDADMDSRSKHKIAFHINGIVLGTLLINGTTVSLIYKRLQIASPHRQEHHEALQRFILKRAEEMTERRVQAMTKHWFFHNCNQRLVREMLVPKLPNTMDHAEDDFYGRLTHPVMNHKIVQDFVEKLVAGDTSAAETVKEHFKAKDEQAQAAAVLCNVFRIDFEGHMHSQIPDDDGSIVRQVSGNNNTAQRMAELVRTRSETDADNLKSDESTFEQEVMTMVTQSIQGQYELMFTTNMIDRSAHEILRASVEHQLEAVEGDLAAYRFLRKETQKYTAKEALEVGWLYIKHMLRSTHDPVMNFITHCAGAHKSISYEYWLTMRNMKVILAFNMTVETALGELEDVSHEAFKANPGLQKILHTVFVEPMKDLIRVSRQELRNLMEADPAMFRIYEHLLFAETVLVHQHAILEELVAEGGMQDHDLKHLYKNVLLPSREALHTYVPSKYVLVVAGTPHAGTFSGWVERVVRFLNFLTSEPIQ
mmetsp:Transcript_22710/g.49916  ORF Transcript_22710/g.49916 Transcript_22710/m.49916 type:complete len:858 (-) Transcript_22710:157-2730(-)